jgi:hypothetical protein
VSAPGIPTVSLSETNTDDNMTITEGTPQSVLVSHTFAVPLQVHVTGFLGGDVPGVTVTFTAPSAAPSGTFTAADCAQPQPNAYTCVATTGGAGDATVHFTADSTAGGPYAVVATATDAPSASFSLTNTNETMTIFEGNNQTGTFGDAFASPLGVTVTNGSGTAQGNVPITFTAPNTTTGPTGTFGPAGCVQPQANNYTCVVDTGSAGPTIGQAAALLTANFNLGTYTVTASSPGVVGASFTETNANYTIAPAPNYYQGNYIGGSGSGQTVAVNTAFANNLQVQVTKPNPGGGPVTGDNVTFTAQTATGGASGTFTAGECSSQPTGAGSCVVPTDDNGVASVTLTANGSAGGPYTVNATAAGSTGIVGLTETNAYQMAILAGNNQTGSVGMPFPVQFQVQLTPTPATPVDVTFTAQPNGASGTFPAASCPLGHPNAYTCVVATSGGIATAPVFTANNNTGGGNAYTVTASATDAFPTADFSETNANYTVNVIQGSGQTAGVDDPFPTPLEVQVVNQQGFGVGGVTVTFSAPETTAGGSFGGAGTCNGTTCTVSVVTDNNGYPDVGYATAPTFTANGTAGAYHVTASAAGAATAASFSETNAAGGLVMVQGSPQTAAINTQFATSLEVEVTGAGGTGVEGKSVTFTAPTTGNATGTFSNGTHTITVMTDTNGDAIEVFKANGSTNGTNPYSVTATSGTLNTVTFTLTNANYTVKVIYGSGQTVAPGTAFPNALIAQVTNQQGFGVGGVTVTFSAPETTAGGSFTGGTCNGTTCTVSVVTDNNGYPDVGYATAPTFTANGTAGSYSVTASVPGAATAATFSETNS